MCVCVGGGGGLPVARSQTLIVLSLDPLMMCWSLIWKHAIPGVGLRRLVCTRTNIAHKYLPCLGPNMGKVRQAAIYKAQRRKQLILTRPPHRSSCVFSLLKK
jgi:hypothetical protein